MGLHKGKVNNPLGRPKGSINKLSRDIKMKITDFINNKIDDIDTVWEQLSPKEKIKFITEILSYVLPKCTAEIKDEPVHSEAYWLAQKQFSLRDKPDDEEELGNIKNQI